MKKILLLILAMALAASAARAQTVKVFVIHNADPGAKPGHEKVLVTAPTDGEMGLVDKLLKDGVDGIRKFEAPSLFGILKQDFVVIDKTGFNLDGEKMEPTTGDFTLVKPSDEETESMTGKLNGFLGFLNALEFQIGLGGAVPVSGDLSRNYHPGFCGDIGLGFKLSPDFSLMLDVEGQSFDSANGKATGGYGYTEADGAILAKLRLSRGPVRPYLFAGPGFAGNQYNLDTSNNGLKASYTFQDGGAFLAEAGLGAEIRVAARMYLYVQGRMVYDFAGNDLSNFIPMDKPVRFVPIQAGVFFGY